MLARKMEIKFEDSLIGTTPMLIPSFSSKANIDICKTIRTMSEFISKGPILVSAYDIFYARDFPHITFPELIFLDSGGYERLIEKEVSEIGFYQGEAYDWSPEKHLKIINEWPKGIPTVVVSYDDPSVRKTTDKQINDAKDLFDDLDDIITELLIKPETIERIRIHIDDIEKNYELLSPFDIIGFTEKELGASILDRMILIAKIRLEMERHDIQAPIHIFGSLDTITTPLYYISGADMFDGLSWIRYVFHKGETLYTTSRAKLIGIEKNLNDVFMANLVYNINYISSLKEDLEILESRENFKHFEYNSNFFEEAYEKLKIKIGEVI
jgi:hypothetical protein